LRKYYIIKIFKKIYTFGKESGKELTDIEKGKEKEKCNRKRNIKPGKYRKIRKEK